MPPDTASEAQAGPPHARAPAELRRAPTAVKVRGATEDDLPRIAVWNGRLQEDEGAWVMSPAAITARLEKWLSHDYEAAIFVRDAPVGYALYRRADTDSEGVGYFLRQFYIDRAHRRRGLGTQAFALLSSEVFSGNRVILEVVEGNHTGRAFWRSLGFEPHSTKYELRTGSVNAGMDVNTMLPRGD